MLAVNKHRVALRTAGPGQDHDVQSNNRHCNSQKTTDLETTAASVATERNDQNNTNLHLHIATTGQTKPPCMAPVSQHA